jgi:hypothetical protein
MKVTTYEGVVENGRIRLPTGVNLPDKGKVYVVVPGVVEVAAPQGAHLSSPRLADPADAVHFRMEVTEDGSDA